MDSLADSATSPAVGFSRSNATGSGGCLIDGGGLLGGGVGTGPEPPPRGLTE